MLYMLEFGSIRIGEISEKLYLLLLPLGEVDILWIVLLRWDGIGANTQNSI